MDDGAADACENSGPIDASSACVYLYRRGEAIVYIGRGASPQRALDHTSGSHNAQLAEIIQNDRYEIQIVGPYPDYEIAKQVEAALISALTPAGRHALVNGPAGDGEKFRPLGVPPAFADRQLLPPLTMSELGSITGGALIVFNSFGTELSPGRPRLDPLDPDPAVLVENLRRYWRMNWMRDQWNAQPELRPFVALSAAGPVKHRYVAAAVPIQRDALGAGAPDEIPIDLNAAPDLNARGLRGRLLSELRFGPFAQDHIKWVDGSGAIRSRRPAS